MDTQNHIDEQLLLDYFSGTLSSTQQQEIETWLQASEENRKTARDIRYIFLATDTIHTIESVDSTRALNDVRKRINRKTDNKHSLMFWFQRIAAILILPLIASSIYFATQKMPVEYIEVRTNPGMVATVTLPDKSKVWLNSKTYLKYPQKFTGETRDVVLDGEAYFSVQKDRSKKFIVSTPFNLKAEVLGTEFNIEAYKESNKVTTALVSGSVRLTYQSKDNKEEALLMKPNEEFEYNAKIGKLKQNDTYMATLTAWKDGLVIFRNTSFEEALKILGKRFDSEFIVKNDLLYNYSFTGTFQSQHLSLILEHFRLSSNIQYKYIYQETDNNKIPEKTIVELY